MSTMTLPPSSSRAGSIRSTATGGSTSTPVQRSAGTPPRRAPQHANTISHKLRHLFDSTPTATFVASLTVHELTNVPQVNGEFAVRWKFRGSRPLDADRMMANAVPRVTGKEAAMAGRSTPTTSVPPSVTSLIRPADANSIRSSTHSTASGPRTVRHASSLPLPHASARREHKVSDPLIAPPTPERRTKVLAEEPAGLEDLAPAPMTPIAPATPTESSPASSREHSMYSDAGSGESGARLGPGSGLKIRTASINESLRGPRVESRASMRSDVSGEPGTPLHPSPAISTARSAISSLRSATYDSKDRKGIIPPAPVRAHVVEWDYSIQHVLRVPLGKAVPVADVPSSRLPASQKKSGHRMLPALGHGPMSDSSVRLEVIQINKADLSKWDKLEGKEGTVLGYVNIDLAPFADQGPTARRYLLLNSRTNATLRISVDMRCIGGEREWITPPFAEGHLTGIQDLTGTEDSYAELQLMPTRSVSSTSSDKSGASRASRPSFRSTRSNISLNQQQVNQVAQMTKHRYHSYEYHLRPEHRRHRHGHGHVERSHTFPIPRDDAPERTATLPLPMEHEEHITSPVSPLLTERKYTVSPVQTPALLPPALSPVTTRGGEYFGALSPGSPTSPRSPHLPQRGVHARYDSTVSDLDSLGLSMHKSPPTPFLRSASPIMEYETLQPDLVIESVFNPSRADELGPFTFTDDTAPYDDGGYGGASYYEFGSGTPVEVQPPPSDGSEEEAEGRRCAHQRWRRIKEKIHHHEKPFVS